MPTFPLTLYHNGSSFTTIFFRPLFVSFLSDRFRFPQSFPHLCRGFSQSSHLLTLLFSVISVLAHTDVFCNPHSRLRSRFPQSPLPPFHPLHRFRQQCTAISFSDIAVLLVGDTPSPEKLLAQFLNTPCGVALDYGGSPCFFKFFMGKSLPFFPSFPHCVHRGKQSFSVRFLCMILLPIACPFPLFSHENPCVPHRENNGGDHEKT